MAILDKVVDKLAYLNYLELLEKYTRYSSLVDLLILGLL